MTSIRKYDQIVGGNIKIDKDKTNEIRITFFEISRFLLYQIWSGTDELLNTNRRVFYQDASDWVLNNFTNYNRQPKYKPTSIMQIYNNRYVMVINDAKINKKGQVIFLCSEIQYSCKNKIPCGKFKNVRFDIDATSTPLAPAILNSGPWFGIIQAAAYTSSEPNLAQQNWTNNYSYPAAGNYIDTNSPKYFSGVSIDSYQNVYVLGELNSTHYIFIYTNYINLNNPSPNYYQFQYISPNQNYVTVGQVPELNQITLTNNIIYAIEIPNSEQGNQLPFNNYSAITLDVNNNIYITATETNIVYYIESVENLLISKSASTSITYLTPTINSIITNNSYKNFIYPTGICIDGNGYLYISITNAVVVYQTPSLPNLGQPDATWSIDKLTYGISVDINNNILVCVETGVYVLSLSGDTLNQVNILSTGSSSPVCIAVDSPNGGYWEWSSGNNGIIIPPSPTAAIINASSQPNQNIVVTCYDGNIWVFQTNSTSPITYTTIFNPVKTINFDNYNASNKKPYILGIAFNIGNLLLISTNTTDTNPIGYFTSNQIYAF